VPGAVFFTPTSFFNTPEIFGTLLAIILPFPAATYLCADPKAKRTLRYSALALFLFLVLAISWTYRPGIWFAALSGLIVVILMQARRAFGLIVALAIFLSLVCVISYGSPSRMLDSVQASEALRADHQRAQINTQVELWDSSNWIGVGRKALDAADYDPGTGNVYFQVLAQSGVLGITFYFLFILGFLLATYRIFQEIPSSHYWHRVFIAGALASQLAFHIAGLYWSTLSEALIVNLFILIIAAVSYLSEHYSRGLVTDDRSL
jgi:O-antigen ligase